MKDSILYNFLRERRLDSFILKRKFQMLVNDHIYSKEISNEKLPVRIYKHKSLIRRKLGNVDMKLQENKAINLAIACPKVSGILIKPNETFSFWSLVGKCDAKRGYKEGLTINGTKSQAGVGGGMCQFTNLIHWLVLHSPLEICEHHHHDGIDLFPDFGRVVPFGCGTSIYYNFLDYQFINKTNYTFQLVFEIDETYLIGELRCIDYLDEKFHIKEKETYFSKENDGYYRNNKIYKQVINKESGQIVSNELIKSNHALVQYDHKLINGTIIEL